MPEGIFSTAAPTRAVFIAAVWRAAVILLRCPKKSSGLRFPRFFRPLRQHALPSSAAGSGRACCPPCSNPFLHLGIKKAHTPKRCMCFFGTPEGIRTPDLLVRSQTLYPTELPAHIKHSGEPLMFNAQILYHIAL